MSIKNQWLILLILVALMAVFLSTAFLSSSTDKYFSGYVEKAYEDHIAQVKEYLEKTLSNKDYPIELLGIELEGHLDDPIVRIKVYNEDGKMIADVYSENEDRRMMGHDSRFMNRMMGNQNEETDNFEIKIGDKVIGYAVITRYSSLDNSSTSRLFKGALIANSFRALAIALIIAIVLGLYVSGKMSRSLKKTAQFAQSVDIGDEQQISISKVSEIKMIQESLISLKSKLKLKAVGRKRLIDELVHQTRTPLTILKNYIEGYEDGVINLNSDEINVCLSQIDSVLYTISNIGEMIDMEGELESIKIEEFDIHQLISRMIKGLKIKFDMKDITVSLSSTEKIILKTDRYKLSQSIYNVLTNAYKFTDKGGHVDISYNQSGDELSVYIEDNGIGMSKEEMARIFEPYYRVGEGDSMGDGLGLYIADKNLRQIEGSISVSSNKGEGSKFTIAVKNLTD